MYPSTTFIIEDRSQIADLPIVEADPKPLFAQFFSSDKGPEEMGEYIGDEFKIFGEPNFARHGQPLLQAQTLINNGAKVLAKRVVAPDATLANTVVLAKVSTVEAQKTKLNGDKLFLTPEGKETTIDDGVNTPIMVKSCNISYDVQSIGGNENDLVALESAALGMANYEGVAEGEEKVYPIMVVADNGRGVSEKKFNITANIRGSRTNKYLSYVFNVIENSIVTESTVFTLNPDIVSATSNLSLASVAKTYLKEVRVLTFDDVMRDFIQTVKTSTGIEDIDNVDILFGKNKKGEKLDAFTIGEEINLSIPVGLPLGEGSNGSFGVSPLKSADYEVALREAFNGTFTKDIYDVDNIMLDGIIDANYPDSVKKAIEALIEFREDALYFRDLGLGLYNADDIIVKAEGAAKSRYVGIYANSYDVIDPYSKKQITVTVGYSLAKLIPAHFINNKTYPFAGQLNGMVFEDIVEGTVNFLPKVIPGKNQKEDLFDRGINFISYLDKVATLESEYTSQEDHTGFSYINNTIAVQEVVKAIRARCPKVRYSFMEREDLEKYQQDVNRVISKYTNNFSSIEMVYAADKTYEQNMVYYAVLYIKFKKFVQAEVFRIVALNDDDIAAI